MTDPKYNAQVRLLPEIIGANFTDQRQAMENQFAGMTDIAFTYDDFEETRMELSSALRGSLTDKDREFLLGFRGRYRNPE